MQAEELIHSLQAGTPPVPTPHPSPQKPEILAHSPRTPKEGGYLGAQMGSWSAAQKYRHGGH